MRGHRGAGLLAERKAIHKQVAVVAVLHGIMPFVTA